MIEKWSASCGYLQVMVQANASHWSFASTALQTDNPLTAVSTQTSTISHLDTSAQASEESEPPLSPSQPQKKSTAPLDWAEDANTLPIIPPSPSPRQLRDLSVLHSSSSSPFSSLQRRLKNRTKKTQQSHCRHSHFYSNSSYSSHHVSFKPLQSYSHTKKYSQLNWECDPRLSDLSHSLKALGWICAFWYHFSFLSYNSYFSVLFCLLLCIFLDTQLLLVLHSFCFYHSLD